MTPNILYTAAHEDEMEAIVVENINGGFSVVLRDLDADASIPFIKTFPTLDRAKTFADTLGA